MQLAPHSSARRSAAGRAIAAGAACAVLLLTGCQGSRWETRTGEPDVPQRVLNLDLGLRNLEEDWAPADSQFTYGLHYAQTLTEGGHGFEVGFLLGSDSGTRSGFDIDSDLIEVYGGYHRAFHPISGGLLPYIGAGVGWFDGQITVGSVRDESKSAFGLYLQGGLGTWLNDRVLLSFGGRFVTGATLDFERGSDLDVTGIMPYVQLGVGF
ncbi:MAG: outer membrane beta-barrel protein [Planctomycetota bacterium]